MLHKVEYDGPAGRKLLIAHGLFGSARNWNVIAKRLSDSRPVVTVDMRNHGASPHFDSHSYNDLAADLAGVIDGQYDVLGHSMGGKAAMVLATEHPEKVGKLIVADIAPIGYKHSQMGPIEAMRGVDLSRVETRADALAQLDGLDPGVPEFLVQSLDMKAKAWKFNLDTLAADMDKIIGFPALDQTFSGDTLFLSGANSDYVKPIYRDKIRGLFPNAKFAKIPGAGHWLHAEKPRKFEAAVRAFLAM
ncbi:alpha/beta fold hydrolase [Yoonia sp. 208BN28-4]|uniref:alpha/beta fold hydrolase n=1 Tax=Yoonia sp. 208BN28-4 TaxID=3126505 RepID=UPI0030974E97